MSSSSSSSSSLGTVLLTGGTAGCGYQSTLQLAQLGYHVIIGCRNMTKAAEAIAKMRLASSSSSRSRVEDIQVEAMKLDTTDLQSIEDCVKLINSKSDHISILVCNAGINANLPPTDGLDTKFLTNYLGHYHLIRLLLPNLHRTSQLNGGESSRIVHVSSCMHRFGTWKWEETARDPVKPGQVESKWARLANYSTSKLAQVVLSCELQRKFAERKVIDFSTPDSVIRSVATTAENHSETSSLVGKPETSDHSNSSVTGANNKRTGDGGVSSVVSLAVHPGAVDSDIWNSYSRFELFFMKPIFGVIFLTPEDGSLTTVHAATMNLNSNPISSHDYHYYSPYGSIGTELPVIGKTLETVGDCYNYPLWAKARRVKMANGVEDEGRAKQLWDLSETLIKEKRGEDIYTRAW